jgi:type II secretory pathway component GspD/PulD (secretin)
MDAEKFILGEGNIMKKLGISLLVLALVLSFVSANAAISARVGLNSATPTAVLVYGMNNIDLQFGYGINAISAPRTYNFGC